jgi:hypothetical protein
LYLAVQGSVFVLLHFICLDVHISLTKLSFVLECNDMIVVSPIIVVVIIIIIIIYLCINQAVFAYYSFDDSFYSSLKFETTTCFGCSLIQPSSGGNKTKELVTQVFLATYIKFFLNFIRNYSLILVKSIKI